MSISLSDLPPDMRKQAEAKLAPQPKLPAHKQEMNKIEAAFAWRLRHEMRVTNIKYASVKLRLAERCWLTPDFSAVRDGRVVFFEVKGGFIREDALIKFKVARQQFPEYDWEMHQCIKGKWERIR